MGYGFSDIARSRGLDAEPHSIVPISNTPLSLPLHLRKQANKQKVKKITSSIVGILKNEGSATAASNNYNMLAEHFLGKFASETGESVTAGLENTLSLVFPNSQLR